LYLNLTLDARMCNGDDVLKASETIKEVWSHPENYL